MNNLIQDILFNVIDLILSQHMIVIFLLDSSVYQVRFEKKCFDKLVGE